MSKVVMIDWGVIIHRSIFAAAAFGGYSPYIGMTIMLAALRQIGIQKDDTIIIAVDDHKRNWRKELDSNYKANRKANRQKRGDIDWGEEFNNFHNLLELLEDSTPWHIVKVGKMEADDIIAVAAKKYNTENTELITISIDSDLDQLFVYPYFKYYSLIKKGFKKPCENPYKLMESKIKKEVSDNLVTPILTKADYILRKKLINLITLPDDIEKKILQALDNMQKPCYNIEYFPFKDKLFDRYEMIFNKGVNYEKSINTVKKRGTKKPKNKVLF